MQQTKKKIIIIFCLIAICCCFAGCSLENTAKDEQAKTEQNQSKLLKIQPPVSLDWSLERDNINKRTTLWNDANKISYIYLINYGKVMAFYTIKGKVSSVNSQITNPEQVIDSNSAYRIFNGNALTMPSPAEDGSYGTNGDAVFFFTTDNVYCEWNGDFLLVDQPLQLSTPPELIREVK